MNKSDSLPFFIVLIVLLVLLGGPSFFNYLPQQAAAILGATIRNDPNHLIVVRVIDGDTIELSNKKVIRFIGVDTPEKNHPTRKVECFATAASNKTAELLTNQEVEIKLDGSQAEKDKYGRTLAYVYRKSDNLFINKELIAQGYAYEFTFNTPYQFQSDFKEAQKNAEQNDLGLWSPDNCNGKR